jgi:hypothetical protein
MKHELKFIAEPNLTFGYQQKAIDPRDGLMLFGPYTRESMKYAPVGIIGTPDGIARTIKWLERIHRPVHHTDDGLARPFFPGLEATFDLSLDIDNIRKLEIDRQLIDKFICYSDGYQRVHNMVNLFVDKLIQYKREEESPVLVWLVIIPDDIYTYCRPNSQAPKSLATTKIGLKKMSRINPLLFEESAKLQEAYRYEKNFHHQLKAKLLEEGIITQIIKESTIAYRDFLNKKGEPIRDLKKFESAIAWNITNALYYKLGGLPWKLGEIREKVCYIGLVYKQVTTDPEETNACCAAQMFLDSGDGMVFKGNVGPWYNPETKEYHLSKDKAYDLLNKTLISFAKKNQKPPDELFIHARTYFNDEEWSGFEEAAKGKSKLVGIRIRDERVFKLYRDSAYPVLRGTAFIAGDKKAYLWTRGYIPRLQTVLGLETPNPLSIEVSKGNGDIETICTDVLRLTKLNYNACIYGDGLPVTLRFANFIGDVLTAGPQKDIEVLPFKHYI